MVENFVSWLDDLVEACGFEISAELKKILLKENETGRIKYRTGEDRSSNRRKGSPGDFREKLKPETVEYLNRELAFVMEYFGYQV